MSYSCGTSSEPLLGMTVGEAFDIISNRHPNNLALISRHQDVRFTYSELYDKVTKCSKAFLKLGIDKGDRVGIWSPNCAEWLITQLATANIGAILVNINPSYRLHELEYVVKQSGCKVIVSDDVFKTSNYTEMLYQLIPNLESVEGNKIEYDQLPELECIISLSEEIHRGMVPWSFFLEGGKEVKDDTLKEVKESLNFDDPINIQYTSGTTGFPKGATLTHHNILNNGYLVTENQHFTSEDKLVIPVPLYHCFGMVMGNLGCITHGATMIYSGRGFNPKDVLEAVQEEKATALYGVPTMFLAELDHPDFEDYDLSTLRTGVMAGALCPSEVMRRVNNDMHMQEVEICYGMTETSPVSTQTRLDSTFEKRVTTVGKVMPHTEIKIVEPGTKKVVKRGEKGELCTRGYCVMQGYWNDPVKTSESIDEARWMHTGDLAIMDEEGYITIVGRIKDMIIRGGENIYPKEIEEFLYKHPSIHEVQVIGIPDERYGEEICAWVQLKEGEKVNEEELKDYCRGKIAHYKIPKYVKFVEEFPMTVTGKIRKVEMREITVKEMGVLI